MSTIGINRPDDPKNLLYVGTFTGAMRWLKGKQVPKTVSKWEKDKDSKNKLQQICKNDLDKCMKFIEVLREHGARVHPGGLKFCAVEKLKQPAKKTSTKRSDLLKFFKKNLSEIVVCIPKEFFLSNYDIEELQSEKYNAPSSRRQARFPSHIMLLKDENNWRNSKGKKVKIPALKPIPLTPELYDSQFFEEMEEGNNRDINESRLATTKSHRRTPIIIIKTFGSKTDEFFDWLSRFRKNDVPKGYCMPWFFDDDDESDTVSGKPTPKSAKKPTDTLRRAVASDRDRQMRALRIEDMVRGWAARAKPAPKAKKSKKQQGGCVDLSIHGTPYERKKYGPSVRDANGKRISGRDSPPYPANKCRDKDKIYQGNDGSMYKSVGPNKRDVYRWQKVAFKNLDQVLFAKSPIRPVHLAGNERLGEEVLEINIKIQIMMMTGEYYPVLESAGDQEILRKFPTVEKLKNYLESLEKMKKYHVIVKLNDYMKEKIKSL